jgi:membrane-associated phospholipid phosphatase
MELPWRERRAAPRTLLVIAAVSAIVSASCILVLDQPVARWLALYEPLALWDVGIEVLEWAVLLPVHKLALQLLLVTGMLVTVSVKRLRVHAPAWMFVTGVHLVSRLTTNWFKDATGRLRPAEWLEQRTDETFGWEGGISFPSGHVVLFASLVIPLAVLYPRLRPLLAIAVFAGLARIGVNAHFLSDTVGAITLVALWTWVVGWLVRPCRR